MLLLRSDAHLIGTLSLLLLLLRCDSGITLDFEIYFPSEIAHLDGHYLLDPFLSLDATTDGL